MLESIKSEWEVVYGKQDKARVYRMKVIGGWLVKDVYFDDSNMVFVPDEHHRWDIDKSLIEKD